MASQAWHGVARFGTAGHGAAWRGIAGMAGWGLERLGSLRQARHGLAWPGPISSGEALQETAGTARRCKARRGKVRYGLVTLARQGLDGQDIAGKFAAGKALQAWHDEARNGESGKVRVWHRNAGTTQ